MYNSLCKYAKYVGYGGLTMFGYCGMWFDMGKGPAKDYDAPL